MSSRRLLGAHLPAVSPQRRETVAGQCLGCRTRFAIDVRLPLPVKCPDCGDDVRARADIEAPGTQPRLPLGPPRIRGGNDDRMQASTVCSGRRCGRDRCRGAPERGAPEDRFEKTTLHVFVGEEDGSLTPAPELVEGAIEARSAIVVAADLNGDTRADLAIFDEGVYVSEPSRLGYGNPPQLFLSSQDGRLRPSEALADAVRHEHEVRPHSRYSGPADLHLKSATPGDIDGDGDGDLWVESTGGGNVASHFMVNNGDGTFTVDTARAPYELLHNPQPEYWRHVGAHLVDLDNDGDLDLALGQIRDLDPTHVNQFSIVLVNDGTGHYPARIELPHPAFNDDYTAVNALTHFDVDGDGFPDLLLVHHRNDDGPPDVIPWTGRHVQVLVNLGTPSPVLRRRRAMSFIDQTPTRMGDQSPAPVGRGHRAGGAAAHRRDTPADQNQYLATTGGR